MAAYNAEQYIDSAICSVLNQTYDDWELIIVDDGSTDNTAQKIDAYSEKDKRIISVHQRNSGTAAQARNTALQYVTGDYVQLLDSDDLLGEDFLEKMEEALIVFANDNQIRFDEIQNLVSVISPIVIGIDEKGQNVGEVTHAKNYVGKTIAGENAFVLSLDWKIHGCVCTNARVLKNIKYAPELINGDEFTTRKLFYTAVNVLFTDAVYYYRFNTNSTTRNIDNRPRTYEALITEGNIYKYVVNECASKNIIAKCRKKWMKSMMLYQSRFNREAKDYSNENKKKIVEILYTNYKELLELDVLCGGMSFFECALRCTGGSYKSYCRICNVYNIVWRMAHCINKSRG